MASSWESALLPEPAIEAPAVRPWDAALLPEPAVGPDVAALTKGTHNAPHGIVNAMISAMQASVSGLAVRGELPSQELPADATTAERFAAGVTGIIGDLPAIIPGAIGGAAAGTLAAPGPGTAVGGAVGGFGAPAAVREYLMQAYRQGGVRSFGELWSVTKSFAEGLGHGGLIGLGTVVPAMKAAQIASIPVRTAAVPLAELTGMTTTAAALEGRLPTLQEFQDNALLIGTFRSVPVVSNKLMEIYAKAGTTPAEVAIIASKNPKLKEQLLDPKHDGVPELFAQQAAAESAKLAFPDPLPKGAEARAQAVEVFQDPFAKPERIEGPKKPGHVNYQYVNSPLEIQLTEARIADVYHAQIEKARQAGRPWEQGRQDATAMLANRLGKAPTEDLLPKTIDPLKAEAHARAAAHLLDGAAAQMINKGREVAALGENAPPELVQSALAAIHQTAAIHAHYSGMVAEAARVLNSRKDLLQSNLSHAELADLLARNRGADNLAQIMKMMTEVNDPARAIKMATAVTDATLNQRVLKNWRALMLSGPTTFIANLLGGVQALVTEIPERAITAGVGKSFAVVKEATAKAAGRQYVPESRASMHEVTAAAHSLLPGALDGLHVAAGALRSDLHGAAARQAVREGLVGGTREFRARVEVLKSNPDMLAVAMKAAGDKYEQVSMSENKAEYAVNTSYRVLQATDLMIRTMAERTEAHALAVRKALSEDFTHGTKEYLARVNELLLHPDKATQDAIAKAGDRAVYTDTLSPRMRDVQNFLRRTPIFQYVVPFFKTPVNLAKRSFEYLPGSPLLMGEVQAALKAGGVARDRVIARQLIGGAIVIAISEGVKAGLVTGGGHDMEPEARASQIAAGRQPYSIKIDGKYYSYQRLQPAATVLAVIADAAELWTSFGVRETPKWVGSLVAATGNALISQNYLQGLSNLVNAISDPGRYGERFMDQYAASLVPAFVGQITAAADPYSREVNSMWDAIKARLPVLRQELLMVRNPLTGEPVHPDKLFPLAPVKVTTESDNKVLTEAARLGVTISSAPRKIHIGSGTGKIGDVKVEAKARNEFVRVQGEFVQQILSGLVGSPGWDAIPDLAKKTIYSRAMTSARKMGALTALPPEARAAEAVRIGTEIADAYKE